MSFAQLPALLREVRPLAIRFGDRGWRLYLVGGIVRDQLLDIPLDDATDLDFTTDARPTEIRAAIAGWADAVWDQGERFGTIGFRAAGRTYEVTTHRSEFYDPDSRKPEVRFGDDVRTDLSRRDFTVNAMAVEVPSGELVDPFGGAADLHAGVLRTPIGPAVSFGDDPLRMLRAARFVSDYGLTPAPDVVAAMTAMADRLGIVSAERCRDELEKLVTTHDPTAGLVLLARTGVARRLLGGLDVPESVGSRLAALPEDLRLRMAALFADEPEAASPLLAELRFSNDQRREILGVLHGAASVAGVDPESAPSLRRFARDCGERLDDALALAAQLDGATATAVEAALGVLGETEDLVGIGPALDGDEIMTLLELEAGPDVGRAVDHLVQMRIDRGPMSKDEASAALRGWWESQARNSSTS